MVANTQATTRLLLGFYQHLSVPQDQAQKQGQDMYGDNFREFVCGHLRKKSYTGYR